MKLNNKLVRTILLFILSALSTSCKGHDQYNSDNNASTNATIGKVVTEIDKSIWLVFQDNSNHYWFGSNGKGVYFYDGYTLKQYTEEDGLISNQIRGIQSDKSGNIYFDTPIGISKFNREKFITLEVTNSSNDQWKLNADDLWFRGNGDIDGGYRYTGDTLYHLKFSDFNASFKGNRYGVYCISKDNSGNIWFGTESAGVVRFDGTTLDLIYEKELSVLDDGRVPAVRSIIEDKEGNFWFSNILYRYKIIKPLLKGQSKIDYEKLPGIDLSNQDVKVKLPYYNSALLDDKSGDLWMTNYNEGIWKYDFKKLVKYPINDKQTSALIVSIFQDNKGVLWVGTDNLGLYKFDGEKFNKFEP